MQKVLVVEDERGIRELIRLFLQKEGYSVDTAGDGEQALKMVEKTNYDMILLDIEMPGMDGFEICKVIRERGKTPVLFISGRKEQKDKITGFSLGADDYITKPFDFHELTLRMKAILRRNEWSKKDDDQEVLRFHELQIYLDRCELFIRNKKVNLSNKEFQLLVLLAKNPNRIWSAEQIYDHVWGFYTDGSPKTVKVHIRNLRQKVELEPANPQYIQTVRGFGYKFVNLSS